MAEAAIESPCRGPAVPRARRGSRTTNGRGPSTRRRSESTARCCRTTRAGSVGSRSTTRSASSPPRRRCGVARRDARRFPLRAEGPSAHHALCAWQDADEAVSTSSWSRFALLGAAARAGPVPVPADPHVRPALTRDVPAPCRRQRRFAFEFRHPSFDEAREVLAGARVAWCTAETDRLPSPRRDDPSRAFRLPPAAKTANEDLEPRGLVAHGSGSARGRAPTSSVISSTRTRGPARSSRSGWRPSSPPASRLRPSSRVRASSSPTRPASSSPRRRP